MRIIFIGSGDLAVPTLTALHASAYQITCVITQPDRPSGRGRRLTSTPVKCAALDLQLPVLSVTNINDPACVDHLRAQQAAVGVVIAFGQKIGPVALAAMPGGCINLHPSLLPKYRGAAPIPWAIMSGESRTGVTVFKLIDRMDAGAILTTVETLIGKTETAAELTARLADLGYGAMKEALELFEHDRVPEGTAQNDAVATTAPKFNKQDGWVGFDGPADHIVHRINGLWPWPGAACCFLSADGSREEIVTLARAGTVSQVPIDTSPGVIEDGLRVAAGEGAFEVLEIKPQSGKLMSWFSYVNGRRVRSGDRLVPIDRRPSQGAI